MEIILKLDINRIISVKDIDKRIQGVLAIRVSVYEYDSMEHTTYILHIYCPFVSVSSTWWQIGTCQIDGCLVISLLLHTQVET